MNKEVFLFKIMFGKYVLLTLRLQADQSLGTDAINDLSPKVFLVMVLGGNNCSLD